MDNRPRREFEPRRGLSGITWNVWSKGTILTTTDTEKVGSSIWLGDNIIFRSYVGDHYISTVLLHISLSYFGGRPWKFESAINCEPIRRYQFFNKAKAGHFNLVKYIKEGKDLDQLFSN